MRRYRYIGAGGLAEYGDSPPARVQVTDSVAAFDFCADAPGAERTVTFVVVDEGVWIADRHSEHVACARGADVLAAGEMIFALDRKRRRLEVVAVTNQSTGYCPSPDCWPSVAAALDAASIAHPGRFTSEMHFRRCPSCAALNLVKESWFVCGICDGALPESENLG